jgi:hypothetical protein
MLSWKVAYSTGVYFQEDLRCRKKNNTSTRRELLQRAAVGIGAASLMTGNVRDQAQTTQGHIVSAEQGPVWEMELGGNGP